MSQFPYDLFIYELTSEFSYSFLTFWLQQHRTIPLHGVIVSIIPVSFDLVIIFYPNSMKSSLKYIHIWNWKYLRNTHIYVCMYACLHTLYILSMCVYLYIQIYVYVSIYSLMHGNEFYNDVQTHMSSSTYTLLSSPLPI